MILCLKLCAFWLRVLVLCSAKPICQQENADAITFAADDTALYGPWEMPLDDVRSKRFMSKCDAQNKKYGCSTLSAHAITYN